MIKALSVTLASIATVSASTPARELRLIGELDIDSPAVHPRTRFESWVRLMGKTYKDSEVDAKFAQWVKNDEFIASTNAKSLTYTVGHNEFSDMAWEDFREVYTGYKDSALTVHLGGIPSRQGATGITSKHFSKVTADASCASSKFAAGWPFCIKKVSCTAT